MTIDVGSWLDSIDDPCLPRPVDDVAMGRLGAESVLWGGRFDQAFALDARATFLWSQIDGTVPLDELVEDLAAVLEQDVATVDRDVRTFVAWLAWGGFLDGAQEVLLDALDELDEAQRRANEQAAAELLAAQEEAPPSEITDLDGVDLSDAEVIADLPDGSVVAEVDGVGRVVTLTSPVYTVGASLEANLHGFVANRPVFSPTVEIDPESCMGKKFRSGIEGWRVAVDLYGSVFAVRTNDEGVAERLRRDLADLVVDEPEAPVAFHLMVGAPRAVGRSFHEVYDTLGQYVCRSTDLDVVYEGVLQQLALDLDLRRSDRTWIDLTLLARGDDVVAVPFGLLDLHRTTRRRLEDAGWHIVNRPSVELDPDTALPLIADGPTFAADGVHYRQLEPVRPQAVVVPAEDPSGLAVDRTTAALRYLAETVTKRSARGRDATMADLERFVATVPFVPGEERPGSLARDLDRLLGS